MVGPAKVEAKGKVEKKKKQKKGEYYDTKGELKRTKKFCPKCGPGVFLAEHKNRVHCGKCSYTEMSK